MGEAIVFQYRQSLHLFSAVSQGSGEGYCYSQETGSSPRKAAVTEKVPPQASVKRRVMDRYKIGRAHV